MAEVVGFALLGLGLGSVYAALATGVVVAHLATGTLHLAVGATAAWAALTFDELRRTGDLVLPVLVVPERVSLGGPMATAPALALTVVMAALVGALVHLAVVRPLVTATPTAQIVAMAGVLVAVQSLAVVHFGAAPRLPAPVLPTGTVEVGGVVVTADRWWSAVVALGAAGLVWAAVRLTPWGLAVRALGENPRGALLSGLRPGRLGAVAWAVGGAVVGLVAAVAGSSVVLTPVAFTLAVVPALAAAVAARLSSLPVAALVGLGLGALESAILGLSARSWWPDALTGGLTRAVPLAVIVVVLVRRPGRLGREGARTRVLHRPRVPTPAARPLPAMAAVAAAGVAGLLLTEGATRFALITSITMAVAALSFLPVTGLVGEATFAQATVAGVGGLALGAWFDTTSLPFPIGAVLAAVVAAAVASVVGLPAVRLRGAGLAVSTLAAAVMLDDLVLRNPALGWSADAVTAPALAGWDLAVREGRDVARLPFGLAALAVLVAAVGLVGVVVRAAPGARWIAVRGDERAAAGVGLAPGRSRLGAFAFAGFVAGLAGAMLAAARGRVPVDAYSPLAGVWWLTLAWLGGVTRTAGAVVAGLLAPMGLVATVVFDSGTVTSPTYATVTGALVVVAVIWAPDGLAGAVSLLTGAGPSGRRRRSPGRSVRQTPP